LRERWKLVRDCFEKPKDPTYYLIKEKQVWRFYFRVMKQWFTPCDKCQEKIDKLFGHLGLAWDANILVRFPEYASKELCSKCLSEPEKLLGNAETIILGNKDYEPPIELSRKWDLTSDGNPEIINLTEKDYGELQKISGNILYVLPHWLLVKMKPVQNLGFAGEPP
jgi:hypothetical protein